MLFEKAARLAHSALEESLFQQIMFNMVEQGGVSLSLLGRAGFSMPETRMSAEVNPVSWKLVDLRIPGFPNWWTGRVE